VSMGRIKSLYRISLLGKDSVESLARIPRIDGIWVTPNRDEGQNSTTCRDREASP
jgi:hypothetical protein